MIAFKSPARPIATYRDLEEIVTELGAHTITPMSFLSECDIDWDHDPLPTDNPCHSQYRVWLSLSSNDVFVEHVIEENPNLPPIRRGACALLGTIPSALVDKHDDPIAAAGEVMGGSFEPFAGHPLSWFIEKLRSADVSAPASAD